MELSSISEKNEVNRSILCILNAVLHKIVCFLCNKVVELKCNNLTNVTNDEERTIEKDGYTIDVVPVSKF